MRSSGSLSYRTETRAGSIAHGFTWLAFLALVASLAIRAYLVGRGPWGNMYEFSVAFAMGIVGGYLYLARRYAIRTIAFVPVGVALFLLGYLGLVISSYPYLVPPSLTIWQTAAAPSSQIFMLVGTVALLPVILGYIVFVYWL